jgi:23S rRNA pseudouridine2605 synthase
LSTLSTPSADQLAAARLAHWHHNAEPILTINMLRDWLNTSGLVLYTPRAQQLPSPAPSFVEAILGAANAAPTLADTEEPRSLLTRLIADGAAIPLNLLGNPTGTGSETPDFIVSTLAFPYIFTLRGDKAWKQLPATSGASKVSPLALAAYNLLAEKVTLSAYDLATQLGKEVTETAVLRSLTELWQHLRVIPFPQPDGAATLWELTATRFTKQIKAGANAGQPTALSALISLYLGQAIVATEDEIETFLSPVAPRSRIRDVVHALMSARQLETLAVEGKTVLHVNGELPAFLAIPTPAPDDADAIVVTTEGSTDTEEAPTRITKFVPKPRKVGTGFPARPAAQDRERRPFKRDAAPDFTKPWDEDKSAKRDKTVRRPKSYDAAKTEQAPTDSNAASERQDAPRTYARKPSFDREGRRPSFGAKPGFGSKPSFGSKPRFGSDRPSFGGKSRMGGDRPTFRRDSDSGDSRPPRREFTPRPYEGSGSDESRSPRKTFSKPGTFDSKREGFAGKSFSRDSDSRPPRRTFGDKPSFGSGPRKPGSYTPRPQRESRAFEGGDRSNGFAPRKPFTPREDGAGSSRFSGKPSFSRDRDNRSDRGDRGDERGGRPSGPPFRKFDAPRGKFSSDRPSRPASSDRPARPEGTGRSYGADRTYSDKPKTGFAAKKPYSKSTGSYAGKSSGGSFAGKKPYGKSAGSFSGKPASTFDKFKGNKKPFGNRPPSRKFKPQEGGSAE